MHNTAKRPRIRAGLSTIVVLDRVVLDRVVLDRVVLARVVLALVALTLAACGGGGSGDGGGGNNSGAGGSGVPNAPPVVSALALSTKQNTDLPGQVTASDPTGEKLAFAIALNPASGTLVSFDGTGAFVYRPAPGFLGDDSFRVQVTDAAANVVTGTVSINVHPNHAPVAVNDSMRADGAALGSIKVLDNDTDADGDPLTVTVEEAPLVGTASMNADSSVSVTLPADFKGLTRFKYRATDSSGAFAIATVAVFVGTEPFRVVFAGAAAANGSAEVYTSDFVSAPTALTSGTAGTMRLRGFAVAENGATVAYRREDQTTSTTMDMAFVRTAKPGTKTDVPLPAGATLPRDASNKDQFIISADGRWLALIAHVGSADSVFVLDVDNPAALTRVSTDDTVVATRLRFSRDSNNLFFLASSVPGGSGKTLYTVTPASPAVTTPVSALSDPATSDDVFDYSISADQTAVLVYANRDGRRGLFFIDARQLQTEVRVNHIQGFGESIASSTISPSGGAVGGAAGRRVAYTSRRFFGQSRAYLADISATSNPREIASGADVSVIGFRPDEGGLLFAKNGQVYEEDLGSGVDILIAAGDNAWYDSTGNIVLVQQTQLAGSVSYPILAVTTRGSFGTTLPLGTPAQSVVLNEVSGFDRGVALVAEGPPGGSVPSRARIALVNALAPDKLLYLSDFESPLQLTSATARVVAR